MAATGLRFRIAALAVGLLLAANHLRADDSADIHTAIAGVATALSNGEPALAMAAFSKSYCDYDKLSGYFEALDGAYYVESQIDFTDEDVTASAATVTVHWAMTLTTQQTAFTKNRNADITLKLAREGKHWRITGFSSIAIFDPQ